MCFTTLVMAMTARADASQQRRECAHGSSLPSSPSACLAHVHMTLDGVSGALGTEEDMPFGWWETWRLAWRQFRVKSFDRPSELPTRLPRPKVLLPESFPSPSPRSSLKSRETKG